MMNVGRIDLPLQGMAVGRNRRVVWRRFGSGAWELCGAPSPVARGRATTSPVGRDGKSSQFCVGKNGGNEQFLPYVVVLGRRPSTDSFVSSKIVFVRCGGCAILGMAGECEA